MKINYNSLSILLLCAMIAINQYGIRKNSDRISISVKMSFFSNVCGSGEPLSEITIKTCEKVGDDLKGHLSNQREHLEIKKRQPKPP